MVTSPLTADLFTQSTNLISGNGQPPISTTLNEKQLKVNEVAQPVLDDGNRTGTEIPDSARPEAQMIVKPLPSIDPTLIQQMGRPENAFVRSLLAGKKWKASPLLAKMGEQNIALPPRELLFKKIAFSEGDITLQEVQSLSREDQEIVYRLANIYSQLNLVAIMRELGFRRTEEQLMREGPSIFGCTMDALEMHETLRSFLRHMRSQKLLLTQSEFDQLPRENYVNKGEDIGRILGRDYIERKASELGLKHIKVPKKLIVVNNHTAQLQLRTDNDLGIKASSEEINIYADRIRSVERDVTPEEVSELLKLIEATGYTDIHRENLVIAEDSIYIVDTEFTNFWQNFLVFNNGRQYVDMAKNIVTLLPKEQQQPLFEDLLTKMKTYQKREAIINEQESHRLKEEEDALKKTGCFYGPTFTFTAMTLF